MWKKILLGILAFIVFVVILAFVLTKSISDVANKQLQALRQGDMVGAYALTSKDFRAQTSLEDFEKFVKKYPSLKNNLKSSWSERTINNGQGTLKGKLTATDGGVTPIEYHLVKENNEWKILGFSLHNAGATIDSDVSKEAAKPVVAPTKKDLAQGELYRIYVNDTLNKSGNVDAPKGIIPKTSPKIFTTVYILHAKKGLKVAAQLYCVTTGGKIGPSVATISQNGNIMRSFSFTNTEPTWPVGDYKIFVATANHQSAEVNFKVE